MRAEGFGSSAQAPASFQRAPCAHRSEGKSLPSIGGKLAIPPAKACVNSLFPDTYSGTKVVHRLHSGAPTRPTVSAPA
jgi:hypothetical protein